MWRVLGFLCLASLAAFGMAWVAEDPGRVEIIWRGRQYDMQVWVLVLAMLVGATLLTLLWTIIRFALRIPSLISLSTRTRRRAKGFDAVTNGLVAVGAGDPLAARRHAIEARRHLGEEPLALLLQAQSAQMAGDRTAAESVFQRMAEVPKTKLLGLRGLFVEARRRGDSKAAHDHAQEAARLAPAAGWANEALLIDYGQSGRWREAREILERAERLKIVDKPTARRQRAVLITAEALEQETAHADQALALAREALKLAPDLIPAVALAGRLMGARGDLRKATRLIEECWRHTPHPELAQAYLDLRHGDSARERLDRAERLMNLSGNDPEGRYAVARMAYEARDYARARAVLEPMLAERATTRLCLLMADLEQAEFGSTAKARAWATKATRAAQDKAWVADGIISHRWMPISPASGRIDAFVWMTPPEHLAAPVDPVSLDIDEPEPILPAPPLPPLDEAAIVPSQLDAGPEPRAQTVTAPVIFPIAHAPDDPGSASEEPAPKKGRWRILRSD